MESPEALTKPSKIYKGRLYKMRAMIIAGLFDGPPASAYIIAHNFKVLGERRKMYLTWLVTFLFMAAVFVIDSFIQFPNIVMPLVALVLSVSLMNKFQAGAIDEYIEAGHSPFSNWYGPACWHYKSADYHIHYFWFDRSYIHLSFRTALFSKY